MPPIPDCRPYATVQPPSRVFRVSYGRDPIQLRPWTTITADAPLAGRWDDSYREYRVLYTSATAEGALRETLQRFVPSQDLLDRIAALEHDEGEDLMRGIGVVPISWLASCSLGEIEVEPCELVDVLHSQSIDAYCDQFSQRFTVGDLLGQNNTITQQMSRRMFQHPNEFAGIAALSKLGSEAINYNFFETGARTNVLRAHMRCVRSVQLSARTPALFDVVNQLGLTFEGVWIEDLEQWVPWHVARGDGRQAPQCAEAYGQVKISGV